MDDLVNLEFRNAAEFRYALERYGVELDKTRIMRVIKLSEIRNITVDTGLVTFEISQGVFTHNQVKAVESLNGRSFNHTWEFTAALEVADPEWKLKPDTPANKPFNNMIKTRIEYLAAKFSGQR
jgi:hypothetical protein